MSYGRTVRVTITRLVDIEVEVWYYEGTRRTFWDPGDPEEAEIRSAIDAFTEDPVELSGGEAKEAIEKAMNLPDEDPHPTGPDPDDRHKPF